MPRRSHVFLTRRVNVEGGHSKGIGMWRAGDSGREPRPPSRCVWVCMLVVENTTEPEDSSVRWLAFIY